MDYQIIQNKDNKSLFTIQLNNYNPSNREAIIKSITKTKIILGATVTNNYKTITFNTNSIEKQNQTPINHDTLLLILYNLSTQLKYLINNYSKTFIGYNPKNILVIDENKFIYLPNNEELHDIEDNNITITYPFSQQDFFMSPEMFFIKEIPSKIHYKTSYYSLACLIIYYLPNKQNDQNNQNNQPNNQPNKQNDITQYKIEDIESKLIPIKGTKIYFLLIRCLTNNIENRCILYI